MTNSHRRGIEKLLRFVLPRVPYRCKECWSRFWKFHNPFQTMSSKIIAGASLLCLTAVAIVLVLSNGDKTSDTKTAKPPKKSVASSSDTGKKYVAEKIAPEFKPDRKEPTPTPTPSPTVKSADTPNGQIGAAGGADGKKPATGPSEEPKLTAWEDSPEAGKKPDKTETVKQTPAKPKTDQMKPEKVKTVSEAGTRTLTGVRQVDVEGDFGVIVTADGPIKTFSDQFIKDEKPPKFYIDLPGKWKTKMKDREVKSDMIYRIRFGKHDKFLRVVFDLKKLPVFPELKESGEGMIIILRKSK